jgi:tetratricopeptide (TPR) repeat protein
MSNDSIALTARKAFERGSALVQQGKYDQALPELHSAEAMFRQLDVPGHPFTRPLSNGVSGLANALYLIGRCHQELSGFQQAILHYESSFINAKFEKRLPFRKFSKSINENLLVCYDRLLFLNLPDRVDDMLKSDPVIDAAYQFPYSLDKEAVILARLFELSRERYGKYRDFYRRAKAKDTEIRRREKKSEEGSMRRLSLIIWSILIIIWAIYGTVVIDALLKQN